MQCQNHLANCYKGLNANILHLNVKRMVTKYWKSLMGQATSLEHMDRQRFGFELLLRLIVVVGERTRVSDTEVAAKRLIMKYQCSYLLYLQLCAFALGAKRSGVMSCNSTIPLLTVGSGPAVSGARQELNLQTTSIKSKLLCGFTILDTSLLIHAERLPELFSFPRQVINVHATNLCPSLFLRLVEM